MGILSTWRTARVLWFVAVALFILIGYAYHTKLSEEERKDKCAPCRAALLTVTNRDTAVMDEAEQALGLKASKD